MINENLNKNNYENTKSIYIEEKKINKIQRVSIDNYDKHIMNSTYHKQKNDINMIYLNNKSFEGYEIYMKELHNKIRGYKYQDKKHGEMITQKTINMIDTIDLLFKSKLQCYYCRHRLFILYNNKYEDYQWTLDRIDNNIGHNKENCVISCLKCNLMKKRIDKDKFKFTKQMKIEKII